MVKMVNMDIQDIEVVMMFWLHLRPELLWVFDRGEKLDDEIIETKGKLLDCYRSQREVLDWFNWGHESIRKFK